MSMEPTHIDLNNQSISTSVDNDIFADEKSVLQALVTIRNSPLSAEDKSSLRDLFLDFSGETDTTKAENIKAEILNLIASNTELLPTLTIKSAPTTTNTTEPVLVNPHISKIGFSRPSPSFTFTNKSNKTIPTPAPAPEIQIETPAPVAIPETQAEAQPVETISKPATEPELVTPSPIVPTTDTKATVVEDVITQPTNPVDTSTATATQILVGADLKSRIDEIKRDINNRVGNPVNLINTDERIGKEYMTALLNAMKSVSGGGNELQASEQLEKAYQAALAILPITNTTSSPAPITAPAPEKIESTPAPAPEIQIETPAPVAVPETQAVSQSTEAVVEPAPVAESKFRVSKGLFHQPIDETDSSLATPKEDLSDSVSLNNTNNEDIKVSPLSNSHNGPIIKHLGGSAHTNELPKEEKLKPLTDSTTLPEKIEEIKLAANQRAEEAKKPITDLNAPEIQQGLEKLLSEWSLFKSSGFLGMGPTGINHPLYKELSKLPMAAVVSGRFEGANNDIKQALRDYMNGWRYEQGMVHEMGETFEHYLRRVIKQIITRQRLMPASIK